MRTVRTPIALRAIGVTIACASSLPPSPWCRMLYAVRRSIELSTAVLSIATVTYAWSGFRADRASTERLEIFPTLQGDADILGALHQSNVNEINAAKMAQMTSTDAGVRAFAAQMVSDHTTLDQQDSMLATQLGIPPTLGDSTTARGGSAEMDNLRARSGSAAFDVAYIGSQVQDHMQSLAIVDSSRKVAQNPALRTALVKLIRPVIARHLQMARSVRDRIGR